MSHRLRQRLIAALRRRPRAERGGPHGTGEEETRSSPVPHVPAAVGPFVVAEVLEQPTTADIPPDYDPNIVDFYNSVLRPTLRVCLNCGAYRLPGHRCGLMGRH